MLTKQIAPTARSRQLDPENDLTGWERLRYVVTHPKSVTYIQSSLAIASGLFAQTLHAKGTGLFCTHAIAAGTLIGFYTGCVDELTSELTSELREYAVQLPNKSIVVATRDDIVGTNPMALINEPNEDQTANVDMVSYRVDELDNFADVVYTPPYICAIVACVDIPAYVELLWHYGHGYTRNYSEPGPPCKLRSEHAELGSILAQLPRNAEKKPVFPRGAAIQKCRAGAAGVNGRRTRQRV